MDLFDLFIKIGVDDQASRHIEELSRKLSIGLQTAAKIGTAAIAAAASGIAALTKSAVDNYAEYEQLVGGVDTLFKNASQTIQEYAANAYKTAGMSANEYMSTATSFAATLINSFKDTSTVVTAEMADQMIASLDKQVEAFEQATDAQISLINKQYTENMKLIDEEEYRRLKAIDEQIEAIQEEQEAEDEAIKKRRQEERKAELESAIDNAETAEERKKARKNLSDYIQQIEAEERREERKQKIEELKDQKDAIKSEADLRRQALKEQHDYELKAYKEARDKELSYLKSHLKEQEKAIKASIGTVAEETQLSAEDYAAAAELVNVAMTDIADNASKFGQSVDYIRETYVSLSRGSYEVLDNLSLGYKATKEGVLDLISDAAKLDDSIKENDLSFANLVKSIHAIQVEMGISGISFEEYSELVRNGTMSQEEAFELMGTTAKEASTTISGSTAMMKSAWSNLLTGVADDNADFDRLVNNFIDTLGIAGENILPRIQIALEGAARLVSELAPVIVEQLPVIMEAVLPDLVDATADLLVALAEQLPSIAQELIDAAVLLVDQIGQEISEKVPELSFIFDNLSEVIGAVVSALAAAKTSTIALKTAQAALSLIMGATPFGLVAAAIAALVTAIIVLYNTNEDFRNFVQTAWAVIKEAGQAMVNDLIGAFELFMVAIEEVADGASRIWNEIEETTRKLVDAVVTFFTVDIPNAFNSFIAFVREVAQNVSDTFSEIIEYAKDVLANIVEIFTVDLPEALKSLPEKFLEIGSGIVDGIWEGIQNGWDWLLDSIEDLIDDLIDGIEDATGIEFENDNSNYRISTKTIEPDNQTNANNRVTVNQYIYSESQTAADLMREAIYEQERAVMMGV